MNTNVMESNFAGASSHMGEKEEKERGERECFLEQEAPPPPSLFPILYLLSSRLDDDGKANIIPTL